MEDKRLWISDLGNGTYQNPVLFADYSDPDVILVGDTYYMTASSFQFTPGLPILTSKDLVNWELVNYAISEIPYPDYDAPMHSKGIWAPSIRYHNGLFYIFVGMPDEGIFVLTAKDPCKEWSKPYPVLSGKGYIDPCPFWSEDGTVHVIHAYAKSRIGFKSYLGAFSLSPDLKTVISEDTFIYDGTLTQPTIEGPKVYQRNGYFYIFAPAGGVRPGWQTVLRSKNLLGPFEERVVLKQGNTEINGPHQGALIPASDKKDWFIHFQDRGAYGRIVHLQPVSWSDDWPVIGQPVKSETYGEPVITHDKPSVSSIDTLPCYLEASDSFDKPSLKLCWQWFANGKDTFYSLTKRKGALRLFAKNPNGGVPSLLWNQANILTQKIICPSFTATALFDIANLGTASQTGILMLGGEYASLAIRKEKGRTTLVYIVSETSENHKVEKLLWEKPLSSSINSLTLGVCFGKDMLCEFFYVCSPSEKASVPYRFLPTDHTWFGAKFGLYCEKLLPENESDTESFADITQVLVTTDSH